MPKRKKDEAMLYKVGTVKEIEQIKGRIPKEVYHAALGIVTMLDENYGAQRDIDEDDGGFVLIAETVRDLEEVSQKYLDLDENIPEYVIPIECKDAPYINALFLCNNESGINILIPKAISPETLLDDLEG